MIRHLDIANLSASYGAAKVLHGVDLFVEQGTIAAILGANGAGKTTLLRAVSRAVHSGGTMRFAGQDLGDRTTEQVAMMGIAHVPDGRGTFASLTVAENLQLGGYALRRRAERDSNLEMVFAYFPRLKERVAQQAGTLSGGEQQMLAIGRALMASPKLILLDEPSVGLAPILVKEIFSIMKTINRERGISMLLVEQNVAMALALARHAFVLETGRIVMSGTSKEVASNESVRKAYLGC
jgi:branched-chain amino acid transport system ATP-binding protein